MCVLQTWLLFVLLSVVSMAMGFYDLWKNVPYFKQFVVGMFRPAAAVFEWLEGHTQVGAGAGSERCLALGAANIVLAAKGLGVCSFVGDGCSAPSTVTLPHRRAAASCLLPRRPM